MKTSNSKEKVASKESPNLNGDWRDLGRQLEKSFNEKIAASGFNDQQKILGIIKELVKEQISYENTANSTRTFR